MGSRLLRDDVLGRRLVGARAGFSLVEAVVALLLSSLVIVMVGGIFLAQNRSYLVQLGVTDAHHNARAVTELLSSELRSVMEGGVLLAESDEMTVRTPLVVAAVCATDGVIVGVHTEGGEAAIETHEEELAGFAVMDAAGGWDYYDVDWSAIDDGSSSGVIAGDCYGNGADTVGARDDFHSLKSLDSYHPTVPGVGDVILLFSKTTFKFQTSVLDPTTVGLFRQVNDDPLVEFATGMDSTAQFQYRTTENSSYEEPVLGSSLEHVDVVRIVSEVKEPAPPGIEGAIRYGWSVNVALRNVR